MSDEELRTKILDYIVDSMPDLGTDADVIITLMREYYGVESIETSQAMEKAARLNERQRCIDAAKSVDYYPGDIKIVLYRNEIIKALEAQK